ncbi:hypothetical protein AB0K94_14255 [Streptomyces sp. NPDC053794]
MVKMQAVPVFVAHRTKSTLETLKFKQPKDFKEGSRVIFRPQLNTQTGFTSASRELSLTVNGKRIQAKFPLAGGAPIRTSLEQRAQLSCLSLEHKGLQAVAALSHQGVRPTKPVATLYPVGALGT